MKMHLFIFSLGQILNVKCVFKISGLAFKILECQNQARSVDLMIAAYIKQTTPIILVSDRKSLDFYRSPISLAFLTILVSSIQT